MKITSATDIMKMIVENNNSPVKIYEVAGPEDDQCFTQLGEAERYFDECTVISNSKEYWALIELTTWGPYEDMISIMSEKNLEQWNEN